MVTAKIFVRCPVTRCSMLRIPETEAKATGSRGAVATETEVAYTVHVMKHIVTR
jgi:hypothetical protein